MEGKKIGHSGWLEMLNDHVSCHTEFLILFDEREFGSEIAFAGERILGVILTAEV